MVENQPQVQPAADPLNKGRGGQSDRPPRGAAELIQTEWKVIDALMIMSERTTDESKKAFYYQTLMGHVRTLSMLLKQHSDPDLNQDLAKILSEITKEAKSYCKRLKQK
jgi:hypothetical protein